MNRIGPMRHRVTIQAATTTTNATTGVQTKSWADTHTNVPASVRALTANEQQAAGARNSAVDVEFELRAGIDITSDQRIVFEGDVYDIEPPQLDPTRQRFYRIKAQKGLTDG